MNFYNKYPYFKSSGTGVQNKEKFLNLTYSYIISLILK